MTRSLIRLAMLLGASAVAGALNAAYQGVPWVPDLGALEAKRQRQAELSKKYPGLAAEVERRWDEFHKERAVSLEELRGVLEAGGVVLIDARPASEFERGHLRYDHEPPTLNVEPDTVDANLGRLMPLMGQPIILYCTSDTCELAAELYILLEQNGFSEMRIFVPGWAGIEKAGLPTEAGSDGWQGFAPDPSEAGEETPSDAPAESEPTEAGDGG